MQDENAKRYRETDGTNENGKLNLRVFPHCRIKLFPNLIYRGTSSRFIKCSPLNTLMYNDSLTILLK